MAFQTPAGPVGDYYQGLAYHHQHHHQYRPSYDYWNPVPACWNVPEASNLTMYLAAITRDSNGVPRGKMAHHLAELVQFPELKALLDDVVLCLKRAPQRTLLVSEIGVTISEESRALLRLLKLRILQVLRFFPDRFSIVGVGAGSSISLSHPSESMANKHEIAPEQGPRCGFMGGPRAAYPTYASAMAEKEEEPLVTQHCSSSSSRSLASSNSNSLGRGFEYPMPPPPRFASMLRGHFEGLADQANKKNDQSDSNINMNSAPPQNQATYSGSTSPLRSPRLPPSSSQAQGPYSYVVSGQQTYEESSWALAEEKQKSHSCWTSSGERQKLAALPLTHSSPESGLGLGASRPRSLEYTLYAEGVACDPELTILSRASF